MTTDPATLRNDNRSLRRTIWRAGLTLAAGVPVAMVVLFAAMVGATLAEPAGKPVAVMSGGGPAMALAAVAAAGGSLIEVTGTAVIAISNDPAFVRKLYAAGALLVIRASPGGCIINGSDSGTDV